MKSNATDHAIDNDDSQSVLRSGTYSKDPVREEISNMSSAGVE